MRKQPYRRTQSQSAAALLMTLIVLSMLTILTVGFLASMRIERRAASAYEDTQRAKLVAQGAVSHAIDLLRTNIPEPARLAERPRTAPAENWVSNPGRLTVIRGSSQPEHIGLHTGAVETAPDPDAPRDAESVDLNQPLPGRTEPAIVAPATAGEKRPEMRVRWQNLFKDPSRPADVSNPLVGRYAFWMDDESSRLNFNVALGKPEVRNGTMFGDQLRGGYITPLFVRGGSETNYSDSGQRQWALGRPQSVNLDHLFDSPNQLQHNRLLAHTFLNGFSRYPEAILNFTNHPNPREWYEKEKFNLTFYNRSPEFNAFGRSRFFTTYIPLSLEAGPTYQQPFIYDPTGRYNGSSTEVLHLNSLLGTFGFTSTVEDEDDGGTVAGGNVINRGQIDMLYEYLARQWPGYAQSFAQKYGEQETYQIALNAVLMARMATSRLGTDLENFSRDWGFRSTSVNYAPKSGELTDRTPERFYWRVQKGGTTTLMLPQSPGPHITEVRLGVRSIPADTGSNPSLRQIEYWYEVEYYMNPFGPVLDLSHFPTKMDYFEITTTGPHGTRKQQFGPASPTDSRGAPNWNHKPSLFRLAILPPDNSVLGPAGAKWNGANVQDRRVFRSERRVLGVRQHVVPDKASGDYDPVVFDPSRGTTVNIEFKLRPGMGILDAPGRPKQMIPLGEYAADSLKAKFVVNLTSNAEQAFSWQINDPRLSAHLSAWEENIQGPDVPSRVGTPAQRNVNEPADNSSEKSKFRYIQRAPDNAKIATYNYDRPDEYNTRSRVSSPGYWSFLHTGMQRKLPWKTIDLTSASNDTAPDWLLIDLMGGTYPMAHDQWKIDAKLPDEFSTVSFMNSTAGQVNLNSRIYPENANFKVPARRKPLEAVFKYLRSDSDVKNLVDGIIDYQKDEQVFDYIGELSNAAGYDVAGTQFAKEELLRHMAGSLTTKSNTFGVWGVAQVLQKVQKNREYDRFEKGDRVLAEKRFYALVERYIWAGRDGLPGNAHVSSAGKWDRLAQQAGRISTDEGITDTLFQLPGSPPLVRPPSSNGTIQQRLELDPTGSYAEFDGPEPVGSNLFTTAALGKVKYRRTTLEEAYNPPQPLVKYRVVYFRYLDH